MKLNWTPSEIKALRLHLNASQTKFAKMLGINRQQSVSAWEIGVRPQVACRILLAQLYQRHGSPYLDVEEKR